MNLERAGQIGTVTAGTEYFEDFLIDNVLAFHGGGGLFAEDEAIMGWLFGAH